MDLLDRAFAAAYDRLSPGAERGRLGDLRRELLAGVGGHVVDVGAGVGANLHGLGDGVKRISLLEPDRHMARRLRTRLDDGLQVTAPVEVLEAPGEAIPLPDHSADTVLTTLVLCTVGDVDRTLREVRRVLRPGGTLAVLEHVLGAGATARVQRALRPAWRVVFRGCEPTRPTRQALERAGFDTTGVVSTSLPELGPAAPVIVGRATLV